ncbi:MAG: DUF4416 family protein [Thermodesulfobacteriota bacterium]|nr:DUF4416 family protein [Thermodesulfobacteriota bacterium]
MSDPSIPQPVKLIASVFSRTNGLIAAATDELSRKFGDIDFVSHIFPFNFTTYYNKEMGNDLIRRFLSFDRMILPHRLPDIKLFTNAIENDFSDCQGDRRLNIDPGYISLSHLILATGKGYAHRPYLRKGIYADLTLLYKDRGFRALDWTYPDYRSKEIIGLMNTLRRKYVFQLKGLK